MSEKQIEIKNKIGEYWLIFSSFFRISLFTFGGALAMLPMLQKELVQKNAWLTDEEAVDVFALGQTVPGIIFVNCAAFVGRRQKGLPGAIAATLGVITPAIVIISCVAAFFSNLDQSQGVQKALKGINVTVGVLLLSALIGLIRKAFKDWFTIILGLAAFCAIFFWHISGAIIVVTAAMIGILWKKLWKKED